MALNGLPHLKERCFLHWQMIYRLVHEGWKCGHEGLSLSFAYPSLNAQWGLTGLLLEVIYVRE